MDIEDLRLQCIDVPSASDGHTTESDSDSSSGSTRSSSSDSSSDSSSHHNPRKRRANAHLHKARQARPVKTFRCRKNSSSSSSHSQERLRLRSKSRDSPRRHSPPRRARSDDRMQSGYRSRQRSSSCRRRSPERRKRSPRTWGARRYSPRARSWDGGRKHSDYRPRSADRMRRPHNDSDRLRRASPGRAGRRRERKREGGPGGGIPKALPAAADQPTRRFGMKVTEEDRAMAARNPPLIVSCSRRTDVPWAFLRQYLNGFQEGFMYIGSGARKALEFRPICVQPYNQATRKGVVCISWWSKNYKKWIQAWQKPDSVLHQYPVHLFNFTVNSENQTLEPGMSSSVQERLDQVTFLAKTFGPHTLSCRFDPIVHYRYLIGGPVQDNLSDFETIVRHIGGLGIDHIVFSFCQAYPKTVRNMRAAGLELVELSRAQQCAVLDKLMPIAHQYGVQMRCCGDKGLVGYPITQSDEESALCVAKKEVPQGSKFPVIGQSRCVDSRLADQIARQKGIDIFLSYAKDLRQRKECDCTRSTDIGQYSLQCPHGCIYCYANPQKKTKPEEVTQEPEMKDAPMAASPAPAFGAWVPPQQLTVPAPVPMPQGGFSMPPAGGDVAQPPGSWFAGLFSGSAATATAPAGVAVAPPQQPTYVGAMPTGENALFQQPLMPQQQLQQQQQQQQQLQQQQQQQGSLASQLLMQAYQCKLLFPGSVLQAGAN